MSRKGREWLTKLGVVGTLSLAAVGCAPKVNVPDFVREQCGFGPSQSEATLVKNLVAGQEVKVGPFDLKNQDGAARIRVLEVDWIKFDGKSTFQPGKDRGFGISVNPFADPHALIDIYSGVAHVALRDADPWAYSFTVEHLMENKAQIKNRTVRVVITADCRTLEH